MKLRTFIHRHLEPVDRIGEVMFGLIMALGFTAAVRISREEIDSLELCAEIFGCNLAWGVVDGVMFVMLALFERGRTARIIKGVLSAPTEDAALQRIGAELGDRLELVTTPEERRQLHGWVLEVARRSQPEQARVRREDLLGGVAVGLVILLTLPILVPFLLFANPDLAVRLSNLVALLLLGLLGWRWGQHVGASPPHVAAGVTLVGLILVGITIALGG